MAELLAGGDAMLPRAPTGRRRSARQEFSYNLGFMPISVRSYAKINIGLAIGATRPDGFHELCTVYQTLAIHDTVRVDVARGSGIEIRCKDARVPADESNTCWRVAERVMKSLKQRGKVAITIEKRLPVQGGLGAASSNAVATMFGMERALKQELPPEERQRIAAEVGSDLNLFLMGGTVLGTGRGEMVWPLQDMPETACVVVTPPVGVSTPEAFKDWDGQFGREDERGNSGARAGRGLTAEKPSDRITSFSRTAYLWLVGSMPRTLGRGSPGQAAAGVPVLNDGGRAETPLLDLVRAGIENDFERVVFPKHPELRELKRALEREGASYASLSGSGSTLYGLFESAEAADAAAGRLTKNGVAALATSTLTRQRYGESIFEI
jgi:4-diphosphocytidyl-2-C-methyl-D-erythritol kinase